MFIFATTVSRYHFGQFDDARAATLAIDVILKKYQFSLFEFCLAVVSFPVDVFS